MSRVIVFFLLIAAACSAAGCRKSSTSATPPIPKGSAQATSTQAAALSADDQLMLDYLRLRNEYAGLLEKKAPEADVREASARFQRQAQGAAKRCRGTAKRPCSQNTRRNGPPPTSEWARRLGGQTVESSGARGRTTSGHGRSVPTHFRRQASTCIGREAATVVAVLRSGEDSHQFLCLAGWDWHPRISHRGNSALPAFREGDVSFSRKSEHVQPRNSDRWSPGMKSLGSSRAMIIGEHRPCGSVLGNGSDAGQIPGASKTPPLAINGRPFGAKSSVTDGSQG